MGLGNQSLSKMAIMPIYGKKYIKVFISGKADDLETWYAALGDSDST